MKHRRSLLLIAVALALQPAGAQASTARGQVDFNGPALVVIDPQVDFLSRRGATWSLVGKSAETNHTVGNAGTGFDITVVKDATAAFQLPGLDGCAAALTNFQMIANCCDDHRRSYQSIRQ